MAFVYFFFRTPNQAHIAPNQHFVYEFQIFPIYVDWVGTLNKVLFTALVLYIHFGRDISCSRCCCPKKNTHTHTQRNIGKHAEWAHVVSVQYFGASFAGLICNFFIRLSLVLLLLFFSFIVCFLIEKNTFHFVQMQWKSGTDAFRLFHLLPIHLCISFNIWIFVLL